MENLANSISNPSHKFLNPSKPRILAKILKPKYLNYHNVKYDDSKNTQQEFLKLSNKINFNDLRNSIQNYPGFRLNSTKSTQKYKRNSEFRDILTPNYLTNDK